MKRPDITTGGNAEGLCGLRAPGREARTLVARVGDFSVGFTIDGASVKTASTQPKGVSGPMRCQLMALCGGDQPIETWTDVEGNR